MSKKDQATTNKNEKGIKPTRMGYDSSKNKGLQETEESGGIYRAEDTRTAEVSGNQNKSWNDESSN